MKNTQILIVIFEYIFDRPEILCLTRTGETYIWCFLFYQNMCTLFKKNAISCLFLKNVSPSKRVVGFIVHNLHFPIVKGIAFYGLYKSRVLVIPCKADHFCLFIGLPDDEFKKSRLVSLSNLEFNFFIVLWSNLKETLHYYSYIASNIQNLHSVSEQC